MDASQLFFLHFNALLSEHQRSAQSTVRYHSDKSSESITAGRYSIADAERSVEWRIRTTALGEVVDLLVGCSDDDAESVTRFVDDTIRTALGNALSGRAREFFHRRLVSYKGAVLSGEYWLSGLRVAPALPEEEPESQYRIDLERIVVLDFHVRAIDRHQSMVLSSKLESVFLQRLSLLFATRLEPIPHETIWVLPDADGIPRTDSVRRVRGFYHASRQQATMPSKGELCKAGEYRGSIADRFRTSAADLMTLPVEARPLFRLATKAPLPEALAFEGCARMYHLSLVLRRYSRSASLAYRVAAIDAIVSATKPAFDSVSTFIRHYCPDVQEADDFLDYLYGSVRSAHFHAGATPLDDAHFIPFHPLMDPFSAKPSSVAFEAEWITQRALGSWLREMAERHGRHASDAEGA